MNPKYLDVLACPTCKGPLTYDDKQALLVCTFEKLGFPIKDGIMLLERNHAVDLSTQTVTTTQATQTQQTV